MFYAICKLACRHTAHFADARKLQMPCRIPTADKPLRRLFAWFTDRYLVDYYPIFIVAPLLLTAFLGLGFRRIVELTILDGEGHGDERILSISKILLPIASDDHH